VVEATKALLLTVPFMQREDKAGGHQANMLHGIVQFCFKNAHCNVRKMAHF
jgi:hypothetical protein